MKRGLVVSDLHLLAPRSDGEQLLAQLEGDLRCADVLVLNGDTFDFRWSRLPSEQESIAAASRWLRELLDGFGGEEVHYVLGNHDCLTGFCAELAKLLEKYRALQLHELRLQLGRSLFLHGDCANRRMDEAVLRRMRQGWSRDRPRGRMSAALYGAVDALGVTRQFHRWYFPAPSTTRRVAHYLDHSQPDWREEIDDCYFGHTHVPFRDHTLDGVRFHNTGSGIRGMGFQPLNFKLGPCGR